MLCFRILRCQLGLLLLLLLLHEADLLVKFGQFERQAVVLELTSDTLIKAVNLLASADSFLDTQRRPDFLVCSLSRFLRKLVQRRLHGWPSRITAFRLILRGQRRGDRPLLITQAHG